MIIFMKKTLNKLSDLAFRTPQKLINKKDDRGPDHLSRAHTHPRRDLRAQKTTRTRTKKIGRDVKVRTMGTYVVSPR